MSTSNNNLRNPYQTFPSVVGRQATNQPYHTAVNHTNNPDQMSEKTINEEKQSA